MRKAKKEQIFEFLTFVETTKYTLIDKLWKCCGNLLDIMFVSDILIGEGPFFMKLFKYYILFTSKDVKIEKLTLLITFFP